MKALRCAIYTRKSSEEGLDQSFNSLNAQREACEAYVLSQKSEGWKTIPTLYDDGGFSGGTMARPALQRLLGDIAAHHVDVVVVYKVDRLTRSLADFAKIVEVFDGCAVSFVSVTQAFNTTSSMGRLTLNVLLSFAQFEREVTGERIRDKIAASKAKGMWMGGYPPLGYAARNRTLSIVPDEAVTVRHIFSRYLKLKSVHALAVELEAAGIHSKRHVSGNGQERGGTPFSRGALFHLLRNRIYMGEIIHKQQCFPGLHEPIIDRALFDKVARQLTSSTRRRTDRRLETAPLAGLVHDALGARMTHTHAYGKTGARYRYYVSASSKPSWADRPRIVTRVSANILEELVLDHVRTATRRPSVDWPEVRRLLRRLDVDASSVTLEFASSSDLDTCALMRAGSTFTLNGDHAYVRIPACIQPRKGSTRLTAPAARLARAHFDKALIGGLKRAHRELEEHGISCSRGTRDLDDAQGLDDPYLRRIAPLAFLAPDIQHAILTGRQPPGLTLKRLIQDRIPLCGQAQRDRFGFELQSEPGEAFSVPLA